MKPDTIFLDMDGVLSDLIGGILKLHNIPQEERVCIRKYDDDLYNMVRMSRAALWESIDYREFWYSLDPFVWANELLAKCRRLVPNVYVLSSPAGGAESAAGKLLWLTKNFGGGSKGFRDFILTPHKHLLAKPTAILIDDREDYCKSFSDAGGLSILFPSHDNILRKHSGLQAYGHTINTLRCLANWPVY